MKFAVEGMSEDQVREKTNQILDAVHKKALELGIATEPVRAIVFLVTPFGAQQYSDLSPESTRQVLAIMLNPLAFEERTVFVDQEREAG